MRTPEKRTQDLDPKAESEPGDNPHNLRIVSNEASGISFTPDKRVGRYRLIRPIGHGGMGVVWRASQEEPVKREVAIKLVGSDVGAEAIARFEAERQAIAMMDHTNIATIFDAGTTEDGNPYFVMELVKGIPLDQYCNNHKLGVEARLRLMIPVCRAVQHAHQKAIIHRDLKHSNILVADDGEKPIPKVIDFGLAKALGNQKTLNDNTVYTEYGKVVGTIQYMSPEQADSDGMDIDTRSDIYSLGVILYKLLTGSTPLQRGTESISVIAALKAIREQEPVAPGVAVTSDPERAAWVNQNTPGKRFGEKLTGDLDSIVLKALEKDRRNRYETANGLAMDIERYLNQEPVQAQPRNTMYAIRKFVQRNRRLVASVAAFIGLLIAGIVGTTLSLLFALSENERANQVAHIANEQSVRAKTAEHRARDAEKLTRTQLRAQLHMSAANDWASGKTQSAWQKLRKIQPEDRSWISRYLANEMSTCNPSDSFFGHAHYVITADISSSGELYLSGGADDVVHLWNAESGNEVYRRLFKDLVSCVRFSGDSGRFAVADRSNLVSLFETSTGKLLKTFGPYKTDVTAISFHPKGSVLALCLDENDTVREYNDRVKKFDKDRPAKLQLIDIESGNIEQTLEAHDGEITSLDFDSSGQSLVSGCMDGKVRIWKSHEVKETGTSRFQLEQTILAHVSGVHDVDLSEDGATVASAGEDRIASLWNCETGKSMVQFAGHRSSVLAVDLAPCGKLLATSSRDSSVIVWDLEGKKVVAWQGHAAAVNDVRFTPDSKHVVTASHDQTLRRWKTEPPGKTVAREMRDVDEVWRADFSPDMSVVALAVENGNVILIDTATGEIRKRLDHKKQAVLALDWLKDGRLVTGGDGFGIWIWSDFLQSEESAEPERKVSLGDLVIWDIATSNDEKRLLVAGSDKTTRIFETETFRETGKLQGHSDVVASARFSGDDQQIITASDDKTVRLWNAKTRKQIHCFEDHAHPVWRAVFSPTDSNLVASSSANGEIILWDVEKRRRRPVSFVGHTAPIAGLTFAADGCCLVSACDDGSVRIWEVETGVELFVFQQQPSRPMIHAAFSNDGQSLVTTGVGIVNVRHASQFFASPYLNRDAIVDSIKADERVIAEKISQQELEAIIRSSNKVLDHFPSFEAWSNRGIAQYRLDRYDEAVDSLEEALRLEKILYGMPDLRPWIEGYLALAYARTSDMKQARKIANLLDEEAEDWEGDREYDELRSRVQSAIGN